MKRGQVGVVVALVVVVLAALWVGGFRDDTLVLEQSQYCRMVAMHKQDPSIGWPDYAEAFEQECNDDGTLKVAGR